MGEALQHVSPDSASTLRGVAEVKGQLGGQLLRVVFMSNRRDEGHMLSHELQDLEWSISVVL